MERQRVTTFLKILMIGTGTWRLPLTVGGFARFTYIVYSVVAQGLLALGFLSLILHAVWVVLSTDVDQIFEAVPFCTVLLVINIKLVLIQRSTFRSLLARCELEEDETFQEGPEEVQILLDATVKKSRWIFSALLVNSAILACLLSTMNIVFYFEYRNSDSSVDKPLAVPFWYPFDVNQHYGAAIVLSTFIMISGFGIQLSVQILYLTIMTSVAMQLKALQILARNFHFDGEMSHCEDEFDRNQAAKRVLRRWCLKHKAIISYMEEFGSVIKYVLLLEYTLNAFNIACYIIRLTIFDNSFGVQIFLIGFGVGLIMQLFLMAWYANEIEVQSLALSDALFESKWYEQSESVKKTILIMIIRTRKPINIFIGPFFTMTLQTAISTMKAVYSYVTLMAAITSTKQ